MSENFTPLLSTTDWNEEWKTLQKMRRHVDDPDFWNKRSKTFGSKDAPNVYVEAFLARTGIQPGESVFDMGCGTGALSIPLGKDGHKVIAADFSQGMLDILSNDLVDKHVSTVSPLLMSWAEDWNARGVTKNSVDIALASRSIATADLKDSLMRLSEVARRRVCITLSTGSSPRIDKRIIEALGIKNTFGYDYQYALNILINEGFNPELSYIESVRFDSYDSLDDAYLDFSRMVSDIYRFSDERELEAIKKRLRAWLEAHLVENPSAGKQDQKGNVQKAFRLDKPRSNTWAFIAWNTLSEYPS